MPKHGRGNDTSEVNKEGENKIKSRAGEAGMSGKAGKGAGTLSGGVSGGKATGGTERVNKNDSSGKGSGNR